MTQDGAPAARAVYVYSSVDGSRLGSTTSSASDGSWDVSVPDATKVFIVGMPATGYEVQCTPQLVTPVSES